MKIAVTGSRGLIGSALVPHLRASGHDVVRIVRERATGTDISWDPGERTIEADKLEDVDAVVHLAGAGVGDHRWSAAYKQAILSSRVDGTTTLAETLARVQRPPVVMVSASAVGYYGSRGDEVLTERSESGTGFLADVCRRWEAATAAAADAGIRVVHLRTGVVLSAAGGALKKQLPPFRLGLGARLGSGKQWFSWITRRDAVAAISHLLDDEGASGPFNLAAPEPVPNVVFTHALGSALRRPALLAVPSIVLRVAVGDEMTSEFLVASQRAMPERLLSSGFVFADPALAAALVTALQDR
jgi:uncharacterized protein (TIGR01777 family)